MQERSGRDKVSVKKLKSRRRRRRPFSLSPRLCRLFHVIIFIFSVCWRVENKAPLLFHSNSLTVDQEPTHKRVATTKNEALAHMWLSFNRHFVSQSRSRPTDRQTPESSVEGAIWSFFFFLVSVLKKQPLLPSWHWKGRRIGFRTHTHARYYYMHPARLVSSDTCTHGFQIFIPF